VSERGFCTWKLPTLSIYRCFFLLNVPKTSSDYTELNGSIIYESTGKDEDVPVA